MGETITTSYRCRCGADAVVTHGCTVRKQLSFWSSYRCASCGDAMDSDGYGSPDELRDAFYAANGRWGLRIVDIGPARTQVQKALREALQVSVADVLRIVKSAPHVAAATRTEMEALGETLAMHGAKTELVRLDQP